MVEGQPPVAACLVPARSSAAGRTRPVAAAAAVIRAPHRYHDTSSTTEPGAGGGRCDLEGPSTERHFSPPGSDGGKPRLTEKRKMRGPSCDCVEDGEIY
ncbi:hypothetical protein MTO96_011390 [Rhipicephalus appendiculatus]